MLRKILICQNTGCQSRGSKLLKHRVLELLDEEGYRKQYPNILVGDWDCSEDCELGPIIKVNDSVLLRHAEKEDIENLFQDPESVLGEIMHVLEDEREAFERIIEGELF